MATGKTLVHSFTRFNMENILFKCKFCGKEFDRKRIGGHTAGCKLNPNYQKNRNGNSNVIKAINEQNAIKSLKECPFCNKSWITNKTGFSYHINHCKENPNKKALYWEGKCHSEESKKKISDGMKNAHEEGRAYVWKHRMTEPTRPEQFMIDVLKNELNMENGKDYLREVPYNGFFLDFCWIDKKIVIEMDGEQHQRFQEQIEKDKRKDALLKADGYKELRIPWQECFQNPKEWIEKVKNLFK